MSLATPRYSMSSSIASRGSSRAKRRRPGVGRRPMFRKFPNSSRQPPNPPSLTLNLRASSTPHSMHQLQENRLLISPLSSKEARNLEWARRSFIKHSRTPPSRPRYLSLQKERSKIFISFRRINATERLRCWHLKSRALKARIGLELTSPIMGRISKACAERSLIGSRKHPKMEVESRTQNMLTTFPPKTSRGETSKLLLTATLWALTGPLPRMRLLTNLPSSCLKANLEAGQMVWTRPGAHWVWIREGVRSSLDLWTTSSQSGAITSITDYVYLYKFFLL